MDLGLTGKIAMVTGGSHGLGYQIASCLAREGCHVSICARDKRRVDEVVADLQIKGSNAHGTQADVTVEVIVDNLRKNVATSRDALRRVIPLTVGPRNCGCGFALKGALVTDLGKVPQETLNTLGPIVSNYVP